MSTEPRHVQSVTVENFKGARHIFIPVRTGVTQLVGDNGAGKSSALDAIEAALAGARHVPIKPLTTGEIRGETVLDCGDIIIERRYTERNADRGGVLQVKAKNESKWGQTELNVLFSEYTFDPLEISRMDPAKLASVLQSLAGREYMDELVRIENELKQKASERTVAGRELKTFGTQPDPGPEPEAIPVDDLMAKLAEVSKHNNEQGFRARAIERAGDALAQANSNVGRLETRVAELRQALEKAENEAKAAIIAAATAQNQLEALPQPEALQNATPLQRQIAEAGARNKAREQWHAARQRWDRWVEATTKVNQLERDVKTLQDDRIKHARSVKLPIEGLSLTIDGATYNGLPLEQMSSGERFLVCVDIATALHPTLRLMLIRDGSLIDRIKFAKLCDFADQRGYSILVERVERPQPGGYLIQITEGRSGPLEQFFPAELDPDTGVVVPEGFRPIDAPKPAEPNPFTEE